MGSDNNQFIQNNQTQQDDSQSQQVDASPSHISTGSPESITTVVEQKSNPKSVEYGNESINKIIEQSETKPYQVELNPLPTIPVSGSNQTVKVKDPVTVAPLPIVFGYALPKQLRTPQQVLAMKNKKGDPSESKTWVVVLVDRLLKRHSQANAV